MSLMHQQVETEGGACLLCVHVHGALSWGLGSSGDGRILTQAPQAPDGGRQAAGSSAPAWAMAFPSCTLRVSGVSLGSGGRQSLPPVTCPSAPV